MWLEWCGRLLAGLHSWRVLDARVGLRERRLSWRTAVWRAPALLWRRLRASDGIFNVLRLRYPFQPSFGGLKLDVGTSLSCVSTLLVNSPLKDTSRFSSTSSVVCCFFVAGIFLVHPVESPSLRVTCFPRLLHAALGHNAPFLHSVCFHLRRRTRRGSSETTRGWAESTRICSCTSDLDTLFHDSDSHAAFSLRCGKPRFPWPTDRR